MNWQMVITRNRDALQRIVAALFAMARIVESTAALTSPASGRGGQQDRRGAVTLPRHLYTAIMLILRPAESAIRRLILIAAQGLMFKGLALKPRASRPMPTDLPAFSSAGAQKTPAFCLFDTLKHFDREDFDHSIDAIPTNSFSSSYDEDSAAAPQRIPSQDEPIDAASLYLRLRALRHAISDLPRQARRLARWQQRRDVLLQRKDQFRPVRISPFRPGPPPGYRKRTLHAVDDILRDCHYFAREAMNAPDTS